MYVKISNGAVDQYPYTVGNLRRDNPNTSFPKNPSSELLEDWGLYSVVVADVPSYNERTQKTTQGAAPSLVDGAWTIGFTVEDKTSEEITQYDTDAALSARMSRDYKLSQTDFYALSDVTMSAEMAAYRQALRDITSHANWPNLDEADWPTKP